MPKMMPTTPRHQPDLPPFLSVSFYLIASVSDLTEASNMNLLRTQALHLTLSTTLYASNTAQMWVYAGQKQGSLPA